MRFALAVLLVSNALLSCITHCSEHASSEATKTNAPVGPRPATNHSKSVSAVQLHQGANGMTDQEPRVLNSELMESVQSFGLHIIRKAFDWHSNPEIYADFMKQFVDAPPSKFLYAPAKNFFRTIPEDDLLAMAFFHGARSTFSLYTSNFMHELSMRFGVAATAEALFEIGNTRFNSRTYVAADLLNGQMKEWLLNEFSPSKVFQLLEIRNKNCAPHARLIILQGYINEFNYTYKTKYNLFKTLSEVDHGTADAGLINSEKLHRLKNEEAMMEKLIVYGMKDLDKFRAMEVFKLQPVQLFQPECSYVVKELMLKGDLKDARTFYGDGAFADGILQALEPNTDTDKTAAANSLDWLFGQWRSKYDDTRVLTDRLANEVGHVDEERAKEIARRYDLWKLSIETAGGHS
ncbi:unnamed protein product [Hyaloperonospora brassicae]|uniref:RxLR effector candidate protein n=1 Tax=Hyaloperonospora brassicae TaxID=162125 RepID=A0AAV0TUB3_HYABA|nr:unnamed protein product [Hyaloperonospora brassicae]